MRYSSTRTNYFFVVIYILYIFYIFFDKIPSLFYSKGCVALIYLTSTLSSSFAFITNKCLVSINNYQRTSKKNWQPTTKQCFENWLVFNWQYFIINDFCQLLSAALKIIDEYPFLLKLLGNNLSWSLVKMKDELIGYVFINFKKEKRNRRTGYLPTCHCKALETATSIYLMKLLIFLRLKVVYFYICLPYIYDFVTYLYISPSYCILRVRQHQSLIKYYFLF